MTDEEVICGWMEPKPPDGRGPKVEAADVRWWEYNHQVLLTGPRLENEFHWQWYPHTLTLVECWEVEERLTDEQWSAYAYRLSPFIRTADERAKIFIHAKAEQKIKALATVLRKESL